MANLLNTTEVPDILIGEAKNTVAPSPLFTTQPATVETQPPSQAQMLLQSLWQRQLLDVQNTNAATFKVQELPLARIKKIMKMDEDVKMISAEAPLLFAKAAHMFITELSLRAWIHTEESKRRTLQRNDIATAITKYDQFDFLIDIVPREELKPSSRSNDGSHSSTPLQYFYTIPQQPPQTPPQQQQQPTPNQPTQVRTTSGAQVTGTAIPAGAIVLAQTGGQLVQLGTASQLVSQDTNQQQQQQQQQQVLQISQPQQQTQQQQPQQAATSISADTLQQVIASSGINAGDIQSIQITPDGQIQIVKSSSQALDSLQGQLQMQENSSASAEDATQASGGQVMSGLSNEEQILRLSSAISDDNSPSLVNLSRLQRLNPTNIRENGNN